ncbi:MAG: CBS domain-containing protein [bacterium]|nr:CBS domain-containing protein [bacterium]
MNMLAKDIMSKKVVLVDTEMSVRKLIDIFDKHGISAAPVLDKNKKLKGIVTKSDILGYYIDLNFDKLMASSLQDLISHEIEDSIQELSTEKEKRVKDIMSPKPVKAKVDTPIEKLAETMIKKKIHKIVIVKDDIIKGIVSPIDFLFHISGVTKNG